jgi:hypothetical protein
MRTNADIYVLFLVFNNGSWLVSRLTAGDTLQEYDDLNDTNHSEEYVQISQRVLIWSDHIRGKYITIQGIGKFSCNS